MAAFTSSTKMENIFIGIIMNSMAEMHAEIEAQDRERHEKELGLATLADEFNKLEQQLDALKAQTATLKRRAGEVARAWQATDDAGLCLRRQLR